MTREKKNEELKMEEFVKVWYTQEARQRLRSVEGERI